LQREALLKILENFLVSLVLINDWLTTAMQQKQPKQHDRQTMTSSRLHSLKEM